MGETSTIYLRVEPELKSNLEKLSEAKGFKSLNKFCEEELEKTYKKSFVTLSKIKIGFFFRIITEMGYAELLKIDPKTHEGRNVKCMKNCEGTYQKGKEYFLQWDELVIPI